MACAASAKCR